MVWQATLVVLIIIQTASIVLTKIAADKIPKKSIGIFYQYLFCAGMAVLYTFLNKTVEIGPAVFLIGIAGFANAFGSYYQWQASALSLSRTSLFFPLMEAVSIILTVIFLNEATFWNFQLFTGTILCFSAMLIFNHKDRKENDFTKQWLFYAVAMVLIFGLSGFLIKFFSFNVNQETFLSGWYVGAFLGSPLVLRLTKNNPLDISMEEILIIVPISLTILGALFTLFVTYQLGGPVSLVLPVRGLAITLIPILLGWWLFQERKGLSKKEWFGFLTGIIGATLVLLR